MSKRTTIAKVAFIILLTNIVVAQQPSPVVSPVATASPTPTLIPSSTPSPTSSEAFITPQMVTAISGLWLFALIIVLGILALIFHKQLKRLFNIILDKLEGASQFDVKAGPVGASVTTAVKEVVKEAVMESVKKGEIIPADGATTVKPEVEADSGKEVEPKTSGEADDLRFFWPQPSNKLRAAN